MPGVLPLLGVSLLPALLVLAMVCFSLSREEETIRLPTGTLPRPPMVRETPAISVRLSRQGGVTLGGQAIADGALAAAWQRERAALRLLGFEPSQATVVVHADPDVPTDKVQRLIEKAQRPASRSACSGPPSHPPSQPIREDRNHEVRSEPTALVDAAGCRARAFAGRPLVAAAGAGRFADWRWSSRHGDSVRPRKRFRATLWPRRTTPGRPTSINCRRSRFAFAPTPQAVWHPSPSMASPSRTWRTCERKSGRFSARRPRMQPSRRNWTATAICGMNIRSRSSPRYPPALRPTAGRWFPWSTESSSRRGRSEKQ